MSERRETLARWVPGVSAARSYQRTWLRPDLVAGLVLAAILVPQGMAYAELAGVPAVYGLYTTIGCLVGYALFGPSRVLVLGPDSSVSPLIFAAIVPLAVPGDVQTRVALAGMLALLVGVIEIAMGLGRLGFVADLLSSEVQVGYMNGLAVTIIVGQLPKLCGFSTDATSFGAEVVAWFQHLDETETAALVVGVGVLVVLLVLPRLTTQDPRGARCGRRRDRDLGAPRAVGRDRDRRHTPERVPEADRAVDVDQRRVAAAHRRGRYHARVAHRHDRDLGIVRGAAG